MERDYCSCREESKKIPLPARGNSLAYSGKASKHVLPDRRKGDEGPLRKSFTTNPVKRRAVPPIGRGPAYHCVESKAGEK